MVSRILFIQALLFLVAGAIGGACVIAVRDYAYTAGRTDIMLNASLRGLSEMNVRGDSI